MFDIGFLELILVSIVGLLVLGPERLPVAVRTVGKYVGKLRRSFNNVRAEIERELKNDEIRRQLEDNPLLNDLRETGEEIRKGLSGIPSEDDTAGHRDDPHLQPQLEDDGEKQAGTDTDAPEDEPAAGDTPEAADDDPARPTGSQQP